MSDTGPTTTTIEADAPVVREKDEILRARQDVTVSRFGTLAPMNLAQQLEVAQTMAKAGAAVPAHLRGSPGACLACIEYAHGWGFMTYALARQSYVVKDILCFDAQVIHAVIEKFAPLHEDSLNFEFKGKGDQMIAVVWAQCMIRGRIKKLEWESPEMGLILPKNSPLWKTKPKQQLFYNVSRDWARIHFPHILLGAYGNDELLDSEEIRAEAARDMGTVEDMNRKASGLAARLTGRMGDAEGFHPDNANGIKGEDRVAGPIIDSSELDNIAADTITDDPQGAGDPPQQAGGTGPVQEGQQTAPAPAAAQKAQEPVGGLFADPTPAKAEKPADPPPTDVSSYKAWLKAWLAADTDDAHILERFAEEKGLRERCGVTNGHLKECTRWRSERIQELK
jgi:hypothetical protein